MGNQEVLDFFPSVDGSPIPHQDDRTPKVPKQGSEEGSVLIGEEFLGGWDGEILAELMLLMMDTMPEENPGGLSEEEYTDVLAFLLQENGYPAGDELTTDLLEEILIEFESE